MLAEKLDAPLIVHVQAIRDGAAGPFPTLRCREIVKGIAQAVVDTTDHCKLTEDQAYHFTLGLIRGARLVAAQDDDGVAEGFVLSLLDVFNQRGVSAVRELVEVVTGQELDLPTEAAVH